MIVSRYIETVTTLSVVTVIRDRRILFHNLYHKSSLE